MSLCHPRPPAFSRVPLSRGRTRERRAVRRDHTMNERRASGRRRAARKQLTAAPRVNVRGAHTTDSKGEAAVRLAALRRRG